MKERVPPRQMGGIAMSNGPCLELISASIEAKRGPSAPTKGNGLRRTGMRPSKMGHGPLVVMYPVSLRMKV